MGPIHGSKGPFHQSPLCGTRFMDELRRGSTFRHRVSTNISRRSSLRIRSSRSLHPSRFTGRGSEKPRAGSTLLLSHRCFGGTSVDVGSVLLCGKAKGSQGFDETSTQTKLLSLCRDPDLSWGSFVRGRSLPTPPDR